jgi:deoxyribodipyrimidine photo-lyase
MKFHTSLFIFTRDLRILDNTGLVAACASSDSVIPCFVLNPKIKDSHRFRFLLDCIEDLKNEFAKKKSTLHVLYGNYTQALQQISKMQKIYAVFANQDYTPFAKKRQDQITRFCATNNIPFHQYVDHLMYDPNLIKTQEGNPYGVFSQFFRTAIQIPVAKPQQNEFTNFHARLIDDYSTSSDHTIPIKGGRKSALQILKSIKNFADYEAKRNYPMYQTTMLSAHNRFGTISVRELYHTISENLGIHHTLMNEIHWKEFFSHVLYHFPHVTKEAFRKNRSAISWKHNKAHIDAWKNGRTGFPIVDAGMRELNNTGFMHNRIRMIVASFLSKDLHISWQIGERYFAEKLIDYDLAVNNGNWQWAASTGCDAQPWFRVFNPWLQQKKFDSECKYIKKWIPELEKLSADQIHKLESESFGVDYPRPIVNHLEESKITKQMFRQQAR